MENCAKFGLLRAVLHTCRKNPAREASWAPKPNRTGGRAARLRVCFGRLVSREPARRHP